MGRKSCFVLIILLLCTSAIAGMQPITNPYTGKPDYVGDDGTEFPMGCTSASDFCIIYEDGATRLYMGSQLVSQWERDTTQMDDMDGNVMQFVEGGDIDFVS